MNSTKFKAITILITGYSASGKTTLGTLLKSDLEKEGINNVVLLDGEAVRKKLNNNKYLVKDRNSLGIHKARLALECNQEGKIAIITGIYHDRNIREKVRQLIDNYLEVFLECSAKVCASRDYKGHYKKALNGEYSNFVGVTEPYQKSINYPPEIVIDTTKNTINESAATLLSFTLKYLKVKS